MANADGRILAEGPWGEAGRMRLLVIADSSDSPPHTPDTWVLRLLGNPSESEVPPPDSLALAEEAAAQVRDTYPTWLWRWVQEHQALSLETWSGPIRWWWYNPISEMS